MAEGQSKPGQKRSRMAGSESGETEAKYLKDSEKASSSHVITFNAGLSDEQKLHLKKKMESELADLMGEKSAKGASKIVDDMFKEFLAEKMALIEQEKLKGADEGDGEDDMKEEDSSDGEDESHSGISQHADDKSEKHSRSSKQKKHKKDKKKKKHKEKDRDKSKRHKHKDKDKEINYESLSMVHSKVGSGPESTQHESLVTKHQEEKANKRSIEKREEKLKQKSKERDLKVKLDHLETEEEVPSIYLGKDKFTRKGRAPKVKRGSEECDQDSKRPGVEESLDFDKSEIFTVSLKLPDIKPLEKYKEMTRKGKAQSSSQKEDSRQHPVMSKTELSDLSHNEHKGAEISPIEQQGGTSRRADETKVGHLPDMRLISVLPKRKNEATENTVLNYVIDEASETEDKNLKNSLQNTSLVLSVSEEGQTEWCNDNEEQQTLNEIPLPVSFALDKPEAVPAPSVSSSVEGTSTTSLENTKKKPMMKISLGAIRISETSAALIQSGLKFDTPKQANLEEG